MVAKLELRARSRRRQEGNAAAEENGGYGDFDVVDEARSEEIAKQLAAAEEGDVLPWLLAQFAHHTLRIRFDAHVRESVGSQGAREDDVLDPRRFRCGFSHRPHRVERLPADEERVVAAHRGEVHLRIHHDPVEFAIRTSDVSVETDRTTEAHETH